MAGWGRWTGIAVLLSCGLTACGGDSQGPRSAAGPPSATRPIGVEIAPFNRALAARSCRLYQPLVFSIVRGRPPGAPATAAECRRRRTAFDDYRFSRARSYGTGALMEGPGPGGNREQAVWVLDRDRRFRFTEIAGVSPAQIGTAFTARAEAVRVATRFLRAVRRRDCALMAPLLGAQARLVIVSGSRQAACRAVLDGRLFAPAVRATPDLRPAVLGGTRNIAFVGFRTRRGFFTMVLSDSGAPQLRVLDVLPGPPTPR